MGPRLRDWCTTTVTKSRALARLGARHAVPAVIALRRFRPPSSPIHQHRAINDSQKRFDLVPFRARLRTSRDLLQPLVPTQTSETLISRLALNRSMHRLDQVSRSLAPEDGVGSFVEVVEQVLDLWAGVERVVAVVFQIPVAPIQRP
jgi:hypothetical protein